MEFTKKSIKDIAISGYSGGAGKTFLIKKIIKELDSQLEFSISTTTRPPRGGEEHGVDYYYVSIEEFISLQKEKAFIEDTNPRNGVYYGTTRAEYSRIKEQGKAVAFDVDCYGIQQLKQSLGDGIFTVVLKPSVETRRLWMQIRGNMSPEEMDNRIHYSETKERPFFEQYQEKYFDKIIDPYRNDINKVPFLVNEIINDITQLVH